MFDVIKTGPNSYYRVSNTGIAHYFNNKLHRVDGPAIEIMKSILPNDEIEMEYEWWYFGTKVDCNTQEEFEKLLKIKAFW